MQHAPLGMPALPGQIKFAHAVFQLPFVEMHPQLHQFGNAGRPFGDDGAHGLFVAEAGARHECVLNVEIKRILLAHHTSHSTLRPGGI